MLSEKTYWIILIVVFAAIALSIWFLLIPYSVIEYNLGVNLFTSSIFMVLTIVFLSWFVTLRERIQWKKVEDEVFSNIESYSHALFGAILVYLKEGLKLKLEIMQEREENIRKDRALTELTRLKEMKRLEFEPAILKALLEEKYFFEDIERAAMKYSDIQIKYSKFLSPELTASLMKIQRAVSSIELFIGAWKATQKVKKRFMTIKLASRTLSLYFKELITELYNIHSMEIDFLGL